MSTARETEIVYPESDGKPIADNTIQFRWIIVIYGGLLALFKDRDDVFVASDLLWYPVQGQPRINTAPDSLVAFGRPGGDRRSYLQWQEGNVPPQVVFEIRSYTNSNREMNTKLAFYDRHGVQEYYMFDPDRIVLQGWVRQEGQLAPIAQMQGWVSPLLQVKFELDPTAKGHELIMIGPDGRAFATYLEIVAQREEAERLALQAQARQEQAEQQALNERRQREQAQRREQVERQQREQAQAGQERAEQREQVERQQREQAQQRAARLEAFLRENNLQFDE